MNFVSVFQPISEQQLNNHVQQGNSQFVASHVMASGKVKLSDEKIDILISLWHVEPSLWDTADAAYSNADLRKAALRRISGKMDGLPIGECSIQPL